MDINHFIKERKGGWQELSSLLDRVAAESVESLDARQAHRLYDMYRQVCSDLNRAQTETANPSLIHYLEGLVGRAYSLINVPPKRHFFRAWWDVLVAQFPSVIRRERNLLSLAGLTMLMGILFGFIAVMYFPDSRDVIIPREHLLQTPSERVRHLEEMEKSGKGAIDGAGQHVAFSSFLSTHNIRTACLGFALGFTLGIGTMIILFYNGVMLGGLAAWYMQDHVLTFFVAWIGPHGAIELPCILFGCTAGLMIARAQLRRDKGRFIEQIRDARKDMVSIVIGSASLLVVAGIVEGGFSQINEPTLPYIAKIAVAVFLFGALIYYLFFFRISPKSTGVISLQDNN